MKLYITVISLLISLTTVNAEQGKHLFILSGQSNMQGLNPNISFIPAVTKEFGKDKIIVVKNAKGGQPIRKWYKKWQPAKGESPKTKAELYDLLMKDVNAAIKGQKIQTVTFIWMQGERDANEKHGSVYAKSLKGLIEQVSEDLKYPNINFVIGRLSDFAVKNKKIPHWDVVRKAQVEVAEASPRGAWVDTDDLNDGKNKKGKKIKNDLHYSVQGYKILGERFAKEAISLLKK